METNGNAQFSYSNGSLSLELDCAFLRMSTWLLLTIDSFAQVLQQVLMHGKEGLLTYRSAAVLP